MKKLLMSAVILSSLTQVTNASEDKELWITVGQDVISTANKEIGFHNIEQFNSADGISILKVKESSLGQLTHIMHDHFNRCGGFIRHDSLEEAQAELYASDERLFAEKSNLVDYTIDQQDTVKALVEKVDEFKIRETITKLTSFKNRYYKSTHGVNSSNWIFDHWTELSKGRSDAKVTKWNHTNWPQPSIVLELKGKSDDVIVVGGHADSIAGWFGREEAHAPGADDNASGIATATEVIRLLTASGYQPEKTIMFMAYAAEEVGLLGSKEIARDFKSRGVNVVGALQLDMTNFNGSDLDIVMMSDYTNAAQNAFIGNLIDEYVPSVKWGYDKCGYACSDHASWTSNGYPASMPFESRKGDMNRNIHTNRDTLEQSRGTALHATKFAKMAVSFVVELDK